MVIVNKYRPSIGTYDSNRSIAVRQHSVWTTFFAIHRSPSHYPHSAPIYLASMSYTIEVKRAAVHAYRIVSLVPKSPGFQ
jgi:hypothetical protein